MFTNKNEPMQKTENAAAVNMIGAGTIINGDIVSKGDIRIDGSLKGSGIVLNNTIFRSGHLQKFSFSINL